MCTSDSTFRTYNLFIPNLSLCSLFENNTSFEDNKDFIKQQFRTFVKSLRAQKIVNINHFYILQNKQQPAYFIVKLNVSWYEDEPYSKAIEQKINNNEAITLTCTFRTENTILINNLSIRKYIEKQRQLICNS